MFKLEVEFGDNHNRNNYSKVLHITIVYITYLFKIFIANLTINKRYIFIKGFRNWSDLIKTLAVVIMCKRKKKKKKINFLSFNVQGLKPKLENFFKKIDNWQLLTVMTSLFSQKRWKLTLQKLTLKDSGISYKSDRNINMS